MNTIEQAWYTENGRDNDVVLSTRVRLARNLDGFLFPISMKSDDAERVQSLILDTFNHSSNPEDFQTVRLSQIDTTGKKILSERGIIDPSEGTENWKAVVLRNDGVVSATVNIEDHLRLITFKSGLELYDCLNLLVELQKNIGEKLQYSALKDFGYLTSSIYNTGTGMKASVLLCLPGLCMTGLLERIIREYLAKGFSIHGYYGSENNVSLGCLYQLSNISSSQGDADKQVEQIEQAAAKLVEMERKSRIELTANRHTLLEDTVFRAIVLAKYARFLSLHEAVDCIMKIKLGIATGLITGSTHAEITALLYRAQSAHINFVISGGSIIIEADIVTDELKMDRLRAMVVQEVLKKADIIERR